MFYFNYISKDADVMRSLRHYKNLHHVGTISYMNQPWTKLSHPTSPELKTQHIPLLVWTMNCLTSLIDQMNPVMLLSEPVGIKGFFRQDKEGTYILYIFYFILCYFRNDRCLHCLPTYIKIKDPILSIILSIFIGI